MTRGMAGVVLPTHPDASTQLMQLMRAQSGRHMALATRMLGNTEDAREALQEAWIRAWRYRSTVRDDAARAAWLRRIVARECLRRLRWRKARQWMTFQAVVPEQTDPGPGPEQLTREARQRHAILQATQTLSPKQRLVWGLRMDEGWTVTEIAKATGLKRDTVRTHLARALRKVADRLENDHGPL